MKVELTEKEAALIRFVLHSCKVIKGDNEEEDEVNEIIKKLHYSKKEGRE